MRGTDYQTNVGKAVLLTKTNKNANTRVKTSTYKHKSMKTLKTQMGKHKSDKHGFEPDF
jgi:hypothetical protein